MIDEGDAKERQTIPNCAGCYPHHIRMILPSSRLRACCPKRESSALFCGDLSCLDHGLPAGYFSCKKISELLPVAGDHFEADRLEFRFDVGRIGRSREFGFELRSDRRSQSLWCRSGLPGVHLEILHTGFREGGNIRQSRVAFVACYRERLQPSSLHLLCDGAEILEGHIGMTAY